MKGNGQATVVATVYVTADSARQFDLGEPFNAVEIHAGNSAGFARVAVTAKNGAAPGAAALGSANALVTPGESEERYEYGAQFGGSAFHRFKTDMTHASTIQNVSDVVTFVFLRY